MFKVPVLQRLHSLADDATSFQITDRNSFRAFLGLTPSDLVPDAQTIADFREALIAARTFESLLDVFLEHLKKHGLGLARQGVMLDASLAEVPKQRNRREDNELIKAGEVPPSLQANPKVKAHKDLDARWAKKNNETHDGYKDHVKVDVKDKLILKAVITPANVHDSQALEELIEEGDQVVFADSAYSGTPIAAMLEAKKVKAQINEKGTHGHPLSEEQKASNREKSKTRSRVEHVFAQMSGSMKALYQRYIGIKRNTACLQLTNLVYNLLRFEQIKRQNLNLTA